MTPEELRGWARLYNRSPSLVVAICKAADTIERLERENAGLRRDAERFEKVIKAARKVWLFSRGYVSEGVEIPDMNDESVEEEEAARSLLLYRAIEAYDAAISQPG